MAEPKKPRHSPQDGSYYDLGSYSRSVTTHSFEAKTWFDRGLRWAYAFNHEAAAECFEAAIAYDDDFALAHWGLAYSLGPNYNMPWGFFDEDQLERTVEKTRSETVKAIKAAENASPVEKAIVDALQYRYQADQPPKEWAIWNEDFADAMRKVYVAYGDDLDVAALFADSLMNLNPWNLWNLRTGDPTEGAKTLEAKAVLDKALNQAGGKEHPGLLHLNIHLMEQSKHPEDALEISNCLRGLLPDAGHLNHMPTHLDILCGDYGKAMQWNTVATEADNKYLECAGALNFYSLYRSHNFHFKIYAAMFAGQYKTAMETVEAMEKTMPDELMRIKSPPMADWLESTRSFRHHVLIRFGKWDEIIELQVPSDAELYCYTTSMTHYARGVAFAATGRIDEAVKERLAFLAATDRVPDSRTLFNNKCTDLCRIAAAMLDGEIEYRQGNFDTAFQHLGKAIELDDNLPYDEPWGWMQPTRHAYGALLLEQGRTEDAARVYKADLGLDDTLTRALQHPNNVWALHGYHECLTKLGQDEEANQIKKRLDEASKLADVSIKSSCFCRLHTQESG